MKDYIDRSQKKEKSFERAPAYKLTYQDAFEQVTVTSQNDSGDFWISTKKGREKVSPNRLFADSDENKSRLESISELDKQINGLAKKRDEIVKQMQPFVVSKKAAK